MARRSKLFTVSYPEDLYKVDSWWAELLRKGPKELVSVIWEAQGDLVWKLRLTWESIDNTDLDLKIGLPAYSSIPTSDLLEYHMGLIEELAEVKMILVEVQEKVDEWEIEETASISESDLPSSLTFTFAADTRIVHKEGLSQVDSLIAKQYLWHKYKELRIIVAQNTTKIAEISKELEFRDSPDYILVNVDRGMLRQAFIEQVGHDNEWLFDTERFFEKHEEGLDE